MTSQIGNKGATFLEILLNKKSEKRFLRGFTLLEVMITTAVLALGATLIYQSFFIAVDSFNYYSTLLKITPWMDEKVWQAQNELRHFSPGAAASGDGQLKINNKSINWSLTNNSLDQAGGLYQINLALSWSEGARRAKLSRSAYAIHLEK